VHRSLSWFKSRPGLQPSLLRSFGSASQPPDEGFSWQASQTSLATPELEQRRREIAG
jgi:hypothetical protein